MLESITWKEFLTAAALGTTAWYAYVGIAHYRKDIGMLFKRKNKYDKQIIKESTDTGESEEEQEGSAFAELEMVVMGIRHSILEKAGKEATKEALLTQLQQELAAYEGLKKPAFRIAINNFIMSNANEICGISFSEDELDEAWSKLSR